MFFNAFGRQLIKSRFHNKTKHRLNKNNSITYSNSTSSPVIMSSSYHKPLVICGPSGSGKSTLLNKLMDEFSDCFKFSISHTTRSPRNGETNGKDYHFVDKQTFETMIEQKLFVEFTQFSDNYYGTSQSALEEVQRSGRIPVLDVELKGVFSLKQINLNAKYVFIKPPNFKTLEKNLRSRGSESEENIQKRLKRAVEDIEYIELNPKLFDLIVINDRLEETYNQFKQFVQTDIDGVKKSLSSN